MPHASLAHTPVQGIFSPDPLQQVRWAYLAALQQWAAKERPGPNLVKTELETIASASRQIMILLGQPEAEARL